MEFSIAMDIIPPIAESNLEDLQRRNLVYCPQCLIDIINFVIFILTFVIFVALPLVEITIGINYINDCSMNHNIPIYLFITGFISLIISMFAFFTVKSSFTYLLNFYIFHSGSLYGQRSMI